VSTSVSPAPVAAEPEADEPALRTGVALALDVLDEQREPADAIVRAWLGLAGVRRGGRRRAPRVRDADGVHDTDPGPGLRRGPRRQDTVAAVSPCALRRSPRHGCRRRDRARGAAGTGRAATGGWLADRGRESLSGGWSPSCPRDVAAPYRGRLRRRRAAGDRDLLVLRRGRVARGPVRRRGDRRSARRRQARAPSHALERRRRSRPSRRAARSPSCPGRCAATGDGSASGWRGVCRSLPGIGSQRTTSTCAIRLTDTPSNS